MFTKKEMVLLVDDDDMVNLMAGIVLVRNGYQVLAARTGPETLTLLEQKQAEINLALIDIDLAGGMGGVELAQRLQADRPGLKIIFSTGHDIAVIAENAALEKDADFLQKPYDVPTLLEKIREVLSHAD